MCGNAKTNLLLKKNVLHLNSPGSKLRLRSLALSKPSLSVAKKFQESSLSFNPSLIYSTNNLRY